MHRTSDLHKSSTSEPRRSVTTGSSAGESTRRYLTVTPAKRRALTDHRNANGYPQKQLAALEPSHIPEMYKGLT